MQPGIRIAEINGESGHGMHGESGEIEYISLGHDWDDQDCEYISSMGGEEVGEELDDKVE